jgi:hypothetical protein
MSKGIGVVSLDFMWIGCGDDDVPKNFMFVDQNISVPQLTTLAQRTSRARSPQQNRAAYSYANSHRGQHTELADTSCPRASPESLCDLGHLRRNRGSTIQRVSNLWQITHQH